MQPRGGKRRGRPPKTSYPSQPVSARSNVIVKPKWLLSREGVAADNVPSGSQASPPSFTQQYSARQHVSVTPFKKRGRKPGSGANRGSKGYLPSPSLDNRRKNDNPYGSDSNSETLPAHGEADMEVDVPINYSESEDLIDDAMSDASVSNDSSTVRKVVKSRIRSIPIPLWLQPDLDIPVLILPKSSEDLLLPSHQVLSACAIYEVLRKFSSEIRLSPFRIEDFMATLQSEEPTPLLAEIHVQLLKAMLREEDVQQTLFGPLDLKDSANSMLNFADTLTWPEVMRVFLQSDATFAPALSLLESCEYPFTSCNVRLSLLKFLTDHFLCNTDVRQEFLNEGNIKHNDHCRVCHKVTNSLSCETCPAVYHLHCLDPPLEHVPNEDWQCPICEAQKCKGVTDCSSDVGWFGFLCRQDCLGFDRHGRKYWFVARRIFVEETEEKLIDDAEAVEKMDMEKERKTWYYSSPHQFEQLIATLDKSKFEKNLCRKLNSLRQEILEQMDITVELTNEFKGDSRSYLELDEEAARLAVKTEREESESEEKLEDDANSSNSSTSTYSTRSKTGSIVPRSYSDVKRRRSSSSGTSIKEENGGTVEKSKSPPPTDVIFKLGMEGGHKTYVNQYSSNPLALNKNQASEERDRKRWLSHKFALTGAGEFKWSGSTFGNRTVMLQTVCSTLLLLHSQLPGIFMHPNWATMRKSWIAAVNACVSSRDLGRVLSVLAACIRPVVFTPVWYESLGHIRLQRQTAVEREERKKMERKEKKDKELEEEMHRLHTVHNTKGLKHQVWKQKGEEFRLHGQWGWRWLSATRPLRRLDARQCGLREGPSRIVICSQDDAGVSRFTQCEPSTEVEIYKIPQSDPAMEVVDICAAMNDTDRRVYPKIAKKRKLDSLLDWRLKLKAIEEKNFQKSDSASSTIEMLESPMEAKMEEKEKRVYSSESTKEPLPLKRLLTENEVRTKKKRTLVKYPKMSTNITKSKKRTIFVLPDYELRHLARRHGQGYVQGFHHGPKNNSSAWIYPSARPIFKTCWFYRTNGLQSLSAAALQLRILWACLKWDEMSAKGAMGTGDAKNQTTTDTQIVSTEILAHRHVGRFLEHTQYFQRRSVTKLDVPKTVREVSPSRSGLRKRKMVEAPKLSPPVVTEDWVDEDQLELHEIRHYHERIEKAGGKSSGSYITRLKSQAFGPGGKSLTTEDLKAQAERAAHHLKSAGTPGTLKALAEKQLRRTTKTVTPPETSPASGSGTPPARKIFFTKDENVGQVNKDETSVALASPGFAAASTAASKLQITRGPDGKVHIRGLQPGQQILKLGDGRFTIVSQSPTLMTTQAEPAASSAEMIFKSIVDEKSDVAPAEETVAPTDTSTATQQPSSGKLPLDTSDEQQALMQTANMSNPTAATTSVKTGDSPAATVAGQLQQSKVILQTPQGQRIVVHNLQGGSLTPQQLAAIQEQLKLKLFKQRAQQECNNKPISSALETTSTAADKATSSATTTAPLTSSDTIVSSATTTSSAATTTEVTSNISNSDGKIMETQTTTVEEGQPVQENLVEVTTSPEQKQRKRKALSPENLMPVEKDEAMEQSRDEDTPATKKQRSTSDEEATENCICRQPYDESQFYVYCDRCQHWFHGHCVGVLQTESESIYGYQCPNCEPKGAFNYANTRTLGPRDHEELLKLLRQLQTHESSWPSRDLVNQADVPDQIFKDPIDLSLIETKIQEGKYRRLLEFIGDVRKIFDNCRHSYPEDSDIARCATSLESFLVPRLKMLRSSMSN